MKKILNLVLIFTIAIMLCSCGGETKDPIDDKKPTEFTFGMYPQNEIFDAAIINELKNKVQNENGYYEYEEKKYARVGDRYFEVSPIVWQKITVNGKEMYITENILDQSHFLDISYFEVSIYPYSNKPGTPEGIFANNYQYSDLREFLNDDFLNKAFNNEEKSQMKKVNYDGLSDYIYTLSIEDLNDTIPLTATATAYAVACGVEQIYDEKDPTEFDGNSVWWLRTPNLVHLYRSAGINYDGIIHEYIDCHYDHNGVRPVISFE